MSLPSALHVSLEKQLHKNITVLINRYASFITHLSFSIRDRGIPLDQLRSFLLSQHAFKPERRRRRREEEERVLLYGHIRERLEEAQAISRIFLVLSMAHASIINCEAFVSIAEQFGSSEDHQRLEEYSEHLQSFLDRHNLSEFTEIDPSYGTSIDSVEKLVLRFDFDHTLRIAKVLQLRTAFAEVLGLEGPVLRFFGVDKREGAVVVLICPPAIVRLLFNADTEFSEQQVSEFQALSLLSVEYCEHKFSFAFPEEQVGEDKAAKGKKMVHCG